MHKWINDGDGLCPLCDLMEIENESHFMFYCPLCDKLKEVPHTIIASISANFSSVDDNEWVQRGFFGLNLECLGNDGKVLDSADVKICVYITTTQTPNNIYIWKAWQECIFPEIVFLNVIHRPCCEQFHLDTASLLANHTG